jgi:hypothetical protein
MTDTIESIEPVSPRICASCKYLLGNRTRLDTVENWKCHHPNNIADRRQNLVTGEHIIELRAQFLPSMRVGNGTGDCGEPGNWFELYIRPDYSTPVPIAPVSEATTRAESIARLKKSLKNTALTDL